MAREIPFLFHAPFAESDEFQLMPEYTVFSKTAKGALQGFQSIAKGLNRHVLNFSTSHARDVIVILRFAIEAHLREARFNS